jgi:23S rRNA (adenine-N6)-dimethyltransferase
METELSAENSQHLLKNLDVFGKVFEKEVGKKDRVIEIGAGKGIITKRLAEISGEVLAFETDMQFEENLEKLKKKHSNLNVVYGSALEYRWTGFNKIVSNIPFFISGDLVLKALKENIEEIIIIIGENFKKILEEQEGKIGVIANLFFDIDYICEIEKEKFVPEPKTKCFIVKLKKKKLEEQDLIIKKILRNNGKIKNAIMYALVERGKTKRQAREIIEKMKIEPDILDKPASKITGKFLMHLKEGFAKVLSKP